MLIGMGRSVKTIKKENILRYLRARGYPEAEISSIAPLGQDVDGELKGYGYGQPLCVSFSEPGSDGAEGNRIPYKLVFRTMSADPFNHSRRSDRAEQMLLSFDTFNTIPKHVRALDIGAFREDGELWSVPDGEFFLVTNYIEGTMYADDLRKLVGIAKAPEEDIRRAKSLARYLADLHSQKHDPRHYSRELRDTVGGGEGIFGLCDSYPENHAVATPERLQRIQELAVGWRWRLRKFKQRCARTHGDFHPFNILCKGNGDFAILDCSRGGSGEPADDLCALTVNYLFFALNKQNKFDGALRELWTVHWDEYIEATQDRDILGVVPLYFAWRTLVVSSPLWYPGLSDGLRDRLLHFAERLLEGQEFDPHTIDELLL